VKKGKTPARRTHYSEGRQLATSQEGDDMEGQHWFMLFVVLVIGYVLGRVWTTPAHMIGLP
jgi:hypothetical protein